MSSMIDTVPSSAPKFYLELGRAVAKWQNVELDLCKVFEKVSTCQEDRVASAIFYSPMDFSEKLKMTHSAARLSLKSGDLLQEWIGLRKRLVDESEIRNALVHFMLVFIVTPKGAPVVGPKAGMKSYEGDAKIWLTPNMYNPNEAFKDRRKKTKESLNITAIQAARGRFLRLAADLRKFAAKVPPPLAPQK